MIKPYKILIFLLLFLLPVQSIFSQGKIENKKVFNSALKYIEDEDYNKALEILLNLQSAGEKSTELTYYIGVCYLHSVFNRFEAISYLELVLKDKAYEVPSDIYLELAKLYHEKYDFTQALIYYNTFLNKAEADHLYINYAKRMVKSCEHAQKLIKDSLDVVIENIGEPVNTIYSEYSPFISADGLSLYFNKLSYLNKNYLSEGIRKDSILEIMVANYHNNLWSIPKKIEISANLIDTEINLEGVSPDGQNLFVNITSAGKSDIYSCTIADNTCINLTKLDTGINSDYWDGMISQTPDGTEFYFASDRPGGYGGKDIYKLEKDENGNWANEAINLGPAINTFYDEVSPFIHPDKKTLFYSSEGHMSIGGFDIYKSVYENNSWSYADNLGYPINTTKDEMYFVLTANGKSGFFSSSTNNKYENHDIYIVTLQNSIPLTLVKGKILSGDPPKPISAKIKVIDRETNKRVKYIYNPNPNTGQYLMIFPPGKNYDMVIEAKDFLPQLINIYVPDQTYFYELYQEIILTRINSFGMDLGERLTVNNTFYDIYKTNIAETFIDTQAANDTATKDYNHLLNLIEDIIATTDSLGIEILNQDIDLNTDNRKESKKTKDYDHLFQLVEEAINTTDSVSLAILDNKTLYDDKSSQTFFYAKNKDKNNLVEVNIDGVTIFTKPSLSTKNEDINLPWPKVVPADFYHSDAAKPDTKIHDFKNSSPDDRKVIYTTHVFFENNSDFLQHKFHSELQQIAQLVVNNEKIGVLLNAYTDSKGTEKSNLALSNRRATSVLKYLIDIGLSNRKAILKGYGESKSKNEKSELDRKYNRRVDIEVFELIN